MAEENGYHPEQPEEPQDQRFSEFADFVGRIVDQKIQDTMQALAPQLVAAIRNEVLSAIPQGQPPAVQYGDPPASGQPPARLNLAQYLDEPAKLGELAATFFNAIGAARHAFRPDDAVILREIAGRNPHLMMAYAPDPYGGMFPRVMADTFLKGMQVRASAEGTARTPLPSLYDNPSGLPGGTLPGGNAGPTPTPAPTTGPSPTPGGSGTVAVTSNTYDAFPDATIDEIITELMEVRAARDLAQQKIQVVA